MQPRRVVFRRGSKPEDRKEVQKLIELMGRVQIGRILSDFLAEFRRDPRIPTETMLGRIRDLEHIIKVLEKNREVRRRGPRAKSDYSKAYTIRKTKGSWAPVWKDKELGPKFSTEKERQRLRNAYSQHLRKQLASERSKKPASKLTDGE